MFKKIKFLLFKKGYLNLDDTLKKITFIRDNINMINLYSSSYRNLYDDFLEPDIITYSASLQIIMRSPLDSKPISIKYITESSFKSTSYSYWYSNNGSIIENNDLLKEWLILCYGFIEWAEKAKRDFNNNNSINNYRKLSPYYTNIINIIETLINELKKS